MMRRDATPRSLTLLSTRTAFWAPVAPRGAMSSTRSQRDEDEQRKEKHTEELKGGREEKKRGRYKMESLWGRRDLQSPPGVN
ncbi:hypothetical protein EYF80_045966 [Liparis tanakae]|uniref:Uncharacterized protein n=1 Tax=Liparis tanakae TaxID=230148 RepID=A0A4Z2FSD7_9TELE|nr:hypothetical protein EYF80_045966 [Liparis tanakae]